MVMERGNVVTGLARLQSSPAYLPDRGVPKTEIEGNYVIVIYITVPIYLYNIYNMLSIYNSTNTF